MNNLGLDQIVKLGDTNTCFNQKYLECSICYCLVNSPLECKNKKCKKIFCSSCIETANNNTLNKICPFCRASDELALLDSKYYNIIKNIKLFCYYVDCCILMSIQEYKNHIKDCKLHIYYINIKYNTATENKNVIKSLLGPRSICNNCNIYLFDCKNMNKDNLSLKCVNCCNIYCLSCKYTYNCYNCKSVICKDCLPNKTLSRYDNKCIKEFLCGICDVKCYHCKSKEASDVCYLCNKFICNSNICKISLEIIYTNKDQTYTITISICFSFVNFIKDIIITNNFAKIDSSYNICNYTKCSYCLSSLSSIKKNLVNMNSIMKLNHKELNGVVPNNNVLSQIAKIKLNCLFCNKECLSCGKNKSSTLCAICFRVNCSITCSIKCKRCKNIVCKINNLKDKNIKNKYSCYMCCNVCKQNYCFNCIDQCSGCLDYKVCIDCKSEVLKECNICLTGNTTTLINKKFYCISCWSTCNMDKCNYVLCNNHTISCQYCNENCCKEHLYSCNICNENEIKLCYNTCSFKCSFCSNESGITCKKLNKNNPELKDFKKKSIRYLNISNNNSNNPRISNNIELQLNKTYLNHPYVYNLACSHYCCEACIITCSTCTNETLKISCPQCIVSYYYHYCRYCKNYQCNNCTAFCKDCDEMFCKSCKCVYCKKQINKCKNCWYIDKATKCNLCKSKSPGINHCKDCRKLFICSETCYNGYYKILNNSNKDISNHLCPFYKCKDCDSNKNFDDLEFKKSISLNNKLSNNTNIINNLNKFSKNKDIKNMLNNNFSSKKNTYFDKDLLKNIDYSNFKSNIKISENLKKSLKSNIANDTKYNIIDNNILNSTNIKKKPDINNTLINQNSKNINQNNLNSQKNKVNKNQKKPECIII